MSDNPEELSWVAVIVSTPWVPKTLGSLSWHGVLFGILDTGSDGAAMEAASKYNSAKASWLERVVGVVSELEFNEMDGEARLDPDSYTWFEVVCEMSPVYCAKRYSHPDTALQNAPEPLRLARTGARQINELSSLLSIGAATEACEGLKL